MALPSLGSSTADALREYGRRGVRAVNMVLATATHLDAGMEQAGEVGCYCLREAFNSLMDLEPDEFPSIRSAARDVVSTSRLGGASGEGAQAAALEGLARALDAEQGRRERRLQAVVRRRAGMEPLRFQADLYERTSRLLGDINRNLHADVTVDAATELYEEAVETIDSLFKPMSAKLDEANRLAALEEPTEADVEALEALAADPRALEHFFGVTKKSVWIQRLGPHPGSGRTSNAWGSRFHYTELAARIAAVLRLRVSSAVVHLHS